MLVREGTEPLRTVCGRPAVVCMSERLRRTSRSCSRCRPVTCKIQSVVLRLHCYTLLLHVILAILVGFHPGRCSHLLSCVLDCVLTVLLS